MNCIEWYYSMVFLWLARYHKLLWNFLWLSYFHTPHRIWLSMISMFSVWQWTRRSMTVCPKNDSKVRDTRKVQVITIFFRKAWSQQSKELTQNFERNFRRCLYSRNFVSLITIRPGDCFRISVESKASSGQHFCENWLRETFASSWGLIWERSSFGSWFSILEFQDVSGTDLEWSRTSGFRRNSSSLEKAPNVRRSVLLNSWENFFVTLPSTSSDTWEIKSSCNLGTFVSGTWIFLDVPHVYPYSWLLTSFRFSGLPFSEVRKKLSLLETEETFIWDYWGKWLKIMS